MYLFFSNAAAILFYIILVLSWHGLESAQPKNGIPKGTYVPYLLMTFDDSQLLVMLRDSFKML